MDILISGASIAGPSLAFWLRRFGFNPTVVERSPSLRAGGQAVDFRGSAHLTVLRRMGLLDEVFAHQTVPSDMVFVDVSGKQRAVLPSHFTAGEVEIQRGTLSRILHDASDAEYIFGDWITSLVDDGAGVDVTFQHGPPRRFDLVIGADGMHSGVRSLVFGTPSEFLGYYFAVHDAPSSPVLCNEPGKLAGPGMFLFKSSPLVWDRQDVLAQKEIVAQAFAGMGGETPSLISAMRDSSEFFFDSISRVRMDHVTRGRVALCGDAGWGATLGGMGTGLAVVSAYVLAGELARHRNVSDAFAAYSSLVLPYAMGCQGNAGPFLAPGTRTGIWLRNRLFNLLARLPVGGIFARMDMKAATRIALPDYALPRQVG